MAVRNAENGVVWGGYGALKVNGNVTIRSYPYNTEAGRLQYHRQYVVIEHRLQLTPFHRTTIPTCRFRASFANLLKKAL